MAPLNGSLKQSESHLRDIQTGLLQAHPGRPRHELDLEFDGCWQATRAATKKFDSLRADIRSALDNLIATSSGSGGGGVKTIADPNVRDARLSTQMSRREHYLEQLTARMQSKADSLSSDLATLEDHLQSIGDIVARQNPPTSASVSQPSNQVQNLIESILPEKLPWFLRRARQENARPCSDPPITSHFQVAASEHHAVAEVVRNLSHRLQALQRRKPL
ncbi:hypothetical protein EYZ11_006342 [Aspergillus tanneri]|nr:hypothetical protein EYZ11_006342 [Aspergillus tanneri]